MLFLLQLDQKKIKVTGTKRYVSIVTLSNQDNGKLTRINWNKYQPKVSPERPNQYLDFLVNPGFQGVNLLKIRMIEQYTQDIIFRK